jgi:hypothetical protein
MLSIIKSIFNKKIMVDKIWNTSPEIAQIEKSKQAPALSEDTFFQEFREAVSSVVDIEKVALGFAVAVWMILTSLDNVAEARTKTRLSPDSWYSSKDKVKNEVNQVKAYFQSEYYSDIESSIKDYLLDANKDNYDYLMSSIEQLNSDELEWFLNLTRAAKDNEKDSHKRNLLKKIIMWARKFKSNTELSSSNSQIWESQEKFSNPEYNINITRWSYKTNPLFGSGKKEYWMREFRAYTEKTNWYDYRVVLRYKAENAWNSYQVLYMKIRWQILYTKLISYNKRIHKDSFDISDMIWEERRTRRGNFYPKKFFEIWWRNSDNDLEIQFKWLDF